jgi:hypothetical protein
MCCREYRRAVGTHYGQTLIHQAGHSPRHWKDSDGRAGAVILYHLRIYRWTQPLPVATTGRMVLLEYGQRRHTRRARRTIYRTIGRPGAAHADAEICGSVRGRFLGTTGLTEQRTD